MAIDVEKPSIDEEVVKYQARTVLLQLAYEVALERVLSKPEVKAKIKKAIKIRRWLKALDVGEFLTQVQRFVIIYKLIEISGINNFPTSPVLELRSRPNIVIGSGGGSGSVTSFSAGDLEPLFTTLVTTPASTPALSFTLSSAAANTVFAAPNGASGAPTFRALLAADLPATVVYTNGSYANPSWITSLAWAKITSTPTTLAGYGITDGVTSISTTAPLTGGTITSTGTIGINLFSGDFVVGFGQLFINYTGGVAASAADKGFLTSADWSAFNAKQSALTFSNGLTNTTGTVKQGGAMTSTTTFTGGNTANIDWGSFGQYFGTIQFFTATRFKVEATLGSQILDFNGSTTTFNAGSNLALTIGGSLGISGYVLTSNGTTAAWAPASGGSGYPGPASGTTGDLLRWDVTGTALENFTPSADPTTTDGDLIQRSSGVLARLAAVAVGNVLISGGVATPSTWGKVTLTSHVSGTLPVTNGGTGLATVAQGDILYASAANTILALAKNTTATRYLSNTGTTNNPAWAQVDLTNGVTGVLPLANGGTGASAFPGWLLASGGALTANNAITGAFNLTFSNAQFSRTSTYTMTANNDFGLRYTGTVTGRGTASDTFRFINIDPTLVSGAATQNGTALRIAPTFTPTGGAFSTSTILEAVGTSGTLTIDSTGTLRSPRGISLDATSTGGTNLIFFATGTNASIAANGSNNTLTFTGGSSTNVSNRFVFSHTYAPTSGSNSNIHTTFQNTVNQVGANGSTSGIVYNLVPTAVVGAHKSFVINTSSTLNATNTFTGISIEPSVGTGTFYGIVTNSTTLKNGFGITTPTALLHLGAGGTAASSAPIKFTSGALMTAAEAGAVEFLTDKAYLTITTGAVRKELTLNDAALSSSFIPVATTNGRLTSSLASIDASGVITTSTATVTHTLTFDPNSSSQAIYGLTNSGTVKSLIVKASNGISGSTTGGDLTINAGDGLNSGATNGGNVILLGGTANGAGTAGTIQLQSKAILSNTLRLKAYTVGTLPAGTAGDTAYVTDALTPAFLTIVVGGGAVVTPVFYNGTNWVAI